MFAIGPHPESTFLSYVPGGMYRERVAFAERVGKNAGPPMAEDMFRKLVEAAPEALVLVRWPERIVYANPRYLELLGYETLTELATARPMDIIHPDDRAKLAERGKLLDKVKPTEPAEYRLLRRDGGYVDTECSSLAIDLDGVRTVLTFVRDITARRRAQAQLIQIDRMATIGTLAATVAHELNNPLAYVMLNLGIFERELDELITDPADRARLGERLRVLHEGARHMTSIVRDLRSFCRPAGLIEPVDPRHVLESAISMAMNELADRARLVRDFSPVRAVLADPGRLGQVFLNLLLNAVQSLPPGAEARQHEIRVLLRAEDGDRVRVDITDTGHGIAPELRERIFEPFFTTKPVGVGTGLGLSISKSLVTDMHGELLVESEVGRGSTFRVLLPAVDAPARAPVSQRTGKKAPYSERKNGSATPQARSRVLVVDDEPALVAALNEVLADAHDVTSATSGEEALALLLGDDSFDVILCDVLMPGVSGIELHRELERERPELAKRIVFMSAASFMPNVAEFFARIPNAHVDKPLDLPQIRALVRGANDPR